MSGAPDFVEVDQVPAGSGAHHVIQCVSCERRLQQACIAEQTDNIICFSCRHLSTRTRHLPSECKTSIHRGQTESAARDRFETFTTLLKLSAQSSEQAKFIHILCLANIRLTLHACPLRTKPHISHTKLLVPPLITPIVVHRILYRKPI